MVLLRKVRKILTENFPPPDKVALREDDGIIGVVTSSRFKKVDPIDRQNLIGDLLESKLTPEERREILAIVAVTPEEEAGHTSI